MNDIKDWFGESRIVDEDGHPLVMYRGSRNPDAAPYNADARIYLTPNQEFAMHYARDGWLFPFYVKSERPFDASRDEGLVLWRRFVVETQQEHWATAGTERGALPFWTREPLLTQWLTNQGVNFDAVWFAECDRTASLAVRSLDQLRPAGEPIRVRMGAAQTLNRKVGPQNARR